MLHHGRLGVPGVKGLPRTTPQSSYEILSPLLKSFPIRKASKNYVDLKIPFMKCMLMGRGKITKKKPSKDFKGKKKTEPTQHAAILMRSL